MTCAATRDDPLAGKCEDCGAHMDGDDVNVNVESFEVTGKVLCVDCQDDAFEAAAECDE